MSERPIVIAHRGASGYLPEHTLPAYALAVFQGADYIEPDLVITQDGVLIARHDNLLDLTTDVAKRAEFASRKTTKTVDGREVTGWFSEDFTLAEIKQLRAIERIPDIRPGNQRFDGQFEVPTLDEIIQLVKAMEPLAGRRIGLYPETKHPGYFAERGLALEPPLLDALHAAGYRKADDPVFIQSFEISNLQQLNQKTRLRLVQLLWLRGQPADVRKTGGSLSYAAMSTAGGLRGIAEYADAVGVEKQHFILRPDEQGRLSSANATALIHNAHQAGLLVHAYTFRAENAYLSRANKSAGKSEDYGDITAEIQEYINTGIDGFFIDHPDFGAAALAAEKG